MQYLKQSTQTIVRIGPFMDPTDGVTPVTTIASTGLASADQAEALYNADDTSATTDISGRTITAITGCDGWYNLTLTTADTANLGHLTIVIQDLTATTPVFKDFMVVPIASEEIKELYIKDAAATGTLTTTIFTTGLGTAYTINDSLNGRALIFTGNTTAALKNQAQTITSYTASTGEITLGAPLTVAPANTDAFIII